MITLNEAKKIIFVSTMRRMTSSSSNCSIRQKSLVKDVGRMDEEKFTCFEDVTRTAVLFALGYLYENRSKPDYHGLTMSLRSILFAQREGVV